jgi:hypothetical protein
MDTRTTQPSNPKPAVDALSKWDALNETDDADDDADEIARRQLEFEEFKAAMNRNRLELEGPVSRKIYP